MAKYPDFLKSGDEIRIISPSGIVSPQLIDDAKLKIESWGYIPTEGMFTRAIYGRFAGNEQERFTDLQQALDDPNVKAILCSRGGYGLSQIIDRLDYSRFLENPKWIIGFSDVTILHEVLYKMGVISIHGNMAKHIASLDAYTDSIVQIENILKGKIPAYQVDFDKNNRIGTEKGRLIGGNLAVFMGLRGTKFEPSFKGNILFIEDVGEKPYQIDRMMQNLRLSGLLSQLNGLIVGQFTETEEDPLMNATIYEIIKENVKNYDYPVCFNFSAGHIDNNLPLLMGANVTLNVDEQYSKIEFQSTFWKKTKNLFK